MYFELNWTELQYSPKGNNWMWVATCTLNAPSANVAPCYRVETGRPIWARPDGPVHIDVGIGIPRRCRSAEGCRSMPQVSAQRSSRKEEQSLPCTWGEKGIEHETFLIRVTVFATELPPLMYFADEINQCVTKHLIPSFSAGSGLQIGNVMSRI